MTQKYRYSLRNKAKIVAALGLNHYNLLIDSLNKYFKSIEEIPEYDHEGYTHKFISVPSSYKNSEMEFLFVITGKTYNVYNLAFYSSIG